MLSAHDVANYFLAKQDADAGELISNLKLQKLLYYAQGFHLALFGEPLFGERIKAWRYGPVVPDVWQRFKDAGWSALPPTDNFDPERIEPRIAELLDEVNQVYGQFSATRLRNMTHEEPPWQNAWERDQASASGDNEVSLDDMRAYFAGLVN